MGNRSAAILVTAFLVGCQTGATDQTMDNAAIEAEVLRVAQDGIRIWEEQADVGALTASWSAALGTPWASWDDLATAKASYDAQWAQYDFARSGDAQWQVNVHAPNIASAVVKARYVRTDMAGAQVTQDMTYKQVFVLENGAWKLLLADAVFMPVPG